MPTTQDRTTEAESENLNIPRHQHTEPAALTQLSATATEEEAEILGKGHRKKMPSIKLKNFVVKSPPVQRI